MKDQHGNIVRADILQVLPSHCLCNPRELEAVFASTWYEADGILLTDSPHVGGDCLEDAGLPTDEDGNLIDCKVFIVDDSLKRGNKEDGFYHAIAAIAEVTKGA